MKNILYFLLIPLSLVNVFLPFQNSTLSTKWVMAWKNTDPGTLGNFYYVEEKPNLSYFTFDTYEPCDNWALIPQPAKNILLVNIQFEQQWYLPGIPPDIVRHKPRIVLITLEDSAPQIPIFEKTTPYRINSDLVLPTLAKIATTIGFDVGVFNEFLEGEHAPIFELVQPGDIVGFSVLGSATERFQTASTHAYKAGAQYILSGGDTVQFRPHVALQYCDAVVYRDGWNHVANFLQRLHDDNPPTETVWGIMTNDFSEGILVDNRNLSIARHDKAPEFALDWVDDNHMLPDFSVYSENIWQTIWKNHRMLYGHRVPNPDTIKIGPISLAWGCTKTGNGIACEHCSISLEKMGNVAHVEHLEKLRIIHREMGHNFLFANQPDGGYLLGDIPRNMVQAGFNPSWVKGMELYGLLQDIANKPQLLEQWLKVTQYLVLNASPEGVGEHAGYGSGKTYGNQSASDVYAKNWIGLQAIKDAGPRIGWHGAFIFGMPGATENDYKAILDEVPKLMSFLGEQVWYLEGHLFILSIGSPFANNIIESYEFAKEKAIEFSNKDLSYEDWWKYFGQYQFSLVAPEIAQVAYFDYFTRTPRIVALKYTEEFSKICTGYGLMGGREFTPSLT